MDRGNDWSLLCRVEARLCALPLKSVIETLRPLPIEPVAGTPDFVLGLSIIRGGAVPIVDAGRLLGARGARVARFVMLQVGERRIGLAVAGVDGIRQMAAGSLQELPPLLRSASADAVSAIGTLDSELLMILEAVRIVPDNILAALDAEALAS
jgi:purine-binding chemotaxis protein CheW